VATIGKVSAVFSASTAGLKSGVNEASASFKKLSADVASLRSKMGTLMAIQGAKLFGQVASAARDAAMSLVNMGSAQSETIDKTSKLSRRLGMTYGELSGLALAGDLAGVSMDQIGMAATKADVAFVKAAQGSKQAQSAIAGVGLSVDQLQNKTPAERFKMMADAIAGLPTPAERARASIQLLGKSGADLLPLFEGGAGSIRKATEEAERFGLALTDEQGVAVEGMNDAFTRAYQAVQGVVGQVVAYLAPALQGVTDTFTNLIGGIGGANIGQFIGEGIIAGAEFFATVADSIISGLTSVWEFVSTVVEQFGGVTSLFSAAGSALQAVWYAGEAVFKGIGVILMQSVAGWAGLLAELPQAVVGSGWAEFGKSMEASAGKLAREAEAAGGKAANSALNVVGMGDKGSVGAAALKGPISTILADAARASRDAAATKNVAPTTTVPQKPAAEPVGASTQQLKGTDSRSKEGMAEMFRLMRSTGDDVQEQQLGVLEQIRDAVSEGDGMETVGIMGA
jgi:hypothetical protein